MKVAEKLPVLMGKARAQGNLQYLFVLKGVTCDAVIVILCGLMNLSAHITRKLQKKY